MFAVAALAFIVPCIFAGGDLEIPSNVAVRSLAVKGTIKCGNKPLEGARIRLYRTPQFVKDDIRQIIDEKVTYITGMFQLEGNTKSFPRNETEFDPWLSIHHKCEEDLKKLGNAGYRRFNFKIPSEYVSLGERPRKTYDFGTLNVELGVPGETLDKSYIPNPNAKLTPPGSKN